MSRNKKTVLIASIICFVCIILFTVIGIILDWPKETFSAYSQISSDIIVFIFILWLYIDEIISGFQKCQPIKIVAISVFIFIIATAINYITIYLFPFLETTENERMIKSLLSSAPLLMSVDVIIAGPVKEEIIFRFILQTWLKDKIRKYGRLISVLLTSLLFGFVHSGFSVEILPYMTIGILLGALFEVTGNISVTIITHAFNNFLSCFLGFWGV